MFKIFNKFKVISKFKFLLFLLFLFFIFTSLLGVGLFAFAKHQIKEPLTHKTISKDFVVNSGEGSKEISKRLEKEGFIRNNFWFDIYTFLKGWDNQLKAGNYTLSPSMNIPEIARKIMGGDANLKEIKVTIPEGFNLKKIDKRLFESNITIKPSGIQSLTPKDIDFSEFGFNINNDSLEGYLFPDTYKFKKGIRADVAASKMLNNFDKKITDEIKQAIKEQDKTLNQIITMASIIEKEVPTYYDQRIVSGIFWKRIKNNYPLQSCATIAYALGEDKWRYLRSDLKVDSPYNTYKNKGLPPAPICSPGISAIKAAIYPKKTSYNFFLSKPSGETVFSVTGTEHELNKQRYLK